MGILKDRINGVKKTPTKPSNVRKWHAAKITYNYCGVCGYTPYSATDEPNRAPVKWWDPDDGYKIGSLCQTCAEEHMDVEPKDDDYAVVTSSTNWVCDHEDTDEDPFDAL